MSTSECPLMYEWYGKRYWGAAHGLAGIMNVLMDMELTEDELKDVKGTLIYMINNRFSNGNYRSSEGSTSDHFIDWCLGATGMALTLTKAATVCIQPLIFDKLKLKKSSKTLKFVKILIGFWK